MVGTHGQLRIMGGSLGTGAIAGAWEGPTLQREAAHHTHKARALPLRPDAPPGPAPRTARRPPAGPQELGPP